MNTGHRAFIGLGSNLDTPLQQVIGALEALAQLSHTTLVAASSLYRSAPVGPAGQPDYINAVALLRTELPALELLDRLQRIEDGQGRVRKQRWGPRTLDLDLLLFDDDVIDHPRLQVPHPELANRSFVLEPLFELWPEGQLPDGRMLSHLRQACQEPALERLDL